MRLGGGSTALNPWAYDLRSVEHALAAALASEGEYLPEGSQYLGRALPRERSVPDDQVFEVIDRIIAEAAGNEGSLISELVQDRYFLLMPTGTETNPSWDAWPVADVTLPEASSVFDAVREHERAFDALDDWGDGDADDPVNDYLEELREFAFFAHSETAIRSRGPRAWFWPEPGDRFHPYWHGTGAAVDVAGTSISGPLDFEYDVSNSRTSVEAATKAHFAELAKAHNARYKARSMFNDESEDTPSKADEHIEPLLAVAAAELSQSVTAALREVLVRDSEHGVAVQPEDLVRIFVDRHADAEFVDGARKAVLDWARTSPDSHGIRTELIDEEHSSHQGWGAGSGTIEHFEYRCPCGNGTIVEDHDNIPDFREHSLTIICPKCDKEWRQVLGSPAYGWRIEPIERAAS